MMITPGPSDASAIFALLTAISTPETAKASLQEILKATQDYQTLVETSQNDLKKTKDELDIQKADVEVKLADNQVLIDNINYDLANKQKQVENQLADLSIQWSSMLS